MYLPLTSQLVESQHHLQIATDQIKGLRERLGILEDEYVRLKDDYGKLYEEVREREREKERGRESKGGGERAREGERDWRFWRTSTTGSKTIMGNCIKR